jgi:hypothetical protein
VQGMTKKLEEVFEDASGDEEVEVLVTAETEEVDEVTQAMLAAGDELMEMYASIANSLERIADALELSNQLNFPDHRRMQ